jgi:hypothetical protein
VISANSTIALRTVAGAKRTDRGSNAQRSFWGGHEVALRVESRLSSEGATDRGVARAERAVTGVPPREHRTACTSNGVVSGTLTIA